MNAECQNGNLNNYVKVLSRDVFEMFRFTEYLKDILLRFVWIPSTFLTELTSMHISNSYVSHMDEFESI